MMPSPQTMILEAAISAAESLKLIRLGIKGDAPMGEALGMIEATLDELQFAISAVLDAKEPA